MKKLKLITHSGNLFKDGDFSSDSKLKAFTLVELIVVITILAILGMIAFISLQGYSADARDSSRISDVNHIKTSLELQSLASGKYPLPDNSQDVTYSGGIVVWHQGTVGENVTKILSKNLNEKPTDPLYNTEYIYSVTPTQNQFEVLSIYEGDIVYNVNQIFLSQQEQPHPSFANQPHPSPLLRGEGIEGGLVIEKANASSNTVRIDGNYNGVYVKNGNYIIPTPSLITSLNPVGLELNSTTIKSQVIDRGTNVPDIGTSKVTQSTGALTFSNFQVYNGELNEESSTGAFLSAYQVIANTYSGSSLADEGVIKILLTQTTDEQKIEFTKSLVLSIPTGGSSGTDTGTIPTYNCDDTTKPTDNGNITYTVGNPTSENQSYEKDAENCGYSCTGGYSGDSCEIAPNPYTSCLGRNNPIPFTATTTYTGCNSADIIVCSGAGTGYTISACNVGATIAGTDRTNANTIGKYFQWGRNDGFSYNGGATPTTISTLYPGTSHILGGIDLSGNVTYSNKFIITDSPYDGNWLSKTGQSTDSIWGQGPCENGYHVPSQAEWSGIVTAGQWGNGAAMQTALKLPFSGYRYRISASFDGGNSYGRYWSSTPVSASAYYFHIDLSNINPNSYLVRGGAFSIRCIKD